MVSLVLLRLAVGWHFTTSGYEKLEPKFSSAGFLRQAKGPFAERYHALVPEDDSAGWRKHWDRIAEPVKLEGRDDVLAAWQRWIDAKGKAWTDDVRKTWGEYRVAVENHYGFDKDQKEKAERAFNLAAEPLDELADKHDEALEKHRRAKIRLERNQDEPGVDDVPFLKKRVTEAAAEADATAKQLLDDVRALQRKLQQDLLLLRTENQLLLKGEMPAENDSLAWFDKNVLMPSLIAIGICLMTGFLTPLAAVGGAVFLGFVIATQPPWVAGAADMRAQIAELFALLVLAATGAGRWAGLDFFLTRCCGGCCGAKANDIPTATKVAR